MGSTAPDSKEWHAAELRDELASVIEEAARLVMQPGYAEVELSVLDIRECSAAGYVRIGCRCPRPRLG